MGGRGVALAPIFTRPECRKSSSLFSSNRGSDIMLPELINQVALLKYLSYGLKIENRFQKIFRDWKRPIYGRILLLDHPLSIIIYSV